MIQSVPLHPTLPEWHVSQYLDAKHSRFSQPQITSKGLVASRVPSPLCINSCNMKLQHHDSIAGSWISCKYLLWLKKRTSQACVDLTRNGMTWGSNLLWSKTSIRSASKWSVQIWGQLRLYFVEFGSANLSESNPLALWLLSLLFGSFFKGNMALRLNDRKIVKSPLKHVVQQGLNPCVSKFQTLLDFQVTRIKTAEPWPPSW